MFRSRRSNSFFSRRASRALGSEQGGRKRRSERVRVKEIYSPRTVIYRIALDRGLGDSPGRSNRMLLSGRPGERLIETFLRIRHFAFSEIKVTPRFRPNRDYFPAPGLMNNGLSSLGRGTILQRWYDRSGGKRSIDLEDRTKGR